MALVVEADNALVDLLMGVLIEILFADDLHDVADDAVLANHAAQDRALPFAALRRQAAANLRVGLHGLPPCLVRSLLFLEPGDEHLDFGLDVVAKMELDRE